MRIRGPHGHRGTETGTDDGDRDIVCANIYIRQRQRSQVPVYSFISPCSLFYYVISLLYFMMKVGKVELRNRKEKGFGISNQRSNS